MPLLDRDGSVLVVIDLQPRFWGDRLDDDDRQCAAETAPSPSDRAQGPVAAADAIA